MVKEICGTPTKAPSSATGAVRTRPGCHFPRTSFALGHPAPVVRSREGLVDAAGTASKFVTALLPRELAKWRADAELAVEVLDAVQVYNPDKGRREAVYLDAIGPAGILVADRPQPAVHGWPGDGFERPAPHPFSSP